MTDQTAATSLDAYEAQLRPGLSHFLRSDQQIQSAAYDLAAALLPVEDQRLYKARGYETLVDWIYVHWIEPRDTQDDETALRRRMRQVARYLDVVRHVPREVVASGRHLDAVLYTLAEVAALGGEETKKRLITWMQQPGPRPLWQLKLAQRWAQEALEDRESAEVVDGQVELALSLRGRPTPELSELAGKLLRQTRSVLRLATLVNQLAGQPGQGVDADLINVVMEHVEATRTQVGEARVRAPAGKKDERKVPRDEPGDGVVKKPAAKKPEAKKPVPPKAAPEKKPDKKPEPPPEQPAAAEPVTAAVVPGTDAPGAAPTPEAAREAAPTSAARRGVFKMDEPPNVHEGGVCLVCGNEATPEEHDPERRHDCICHFYRVQQIHDQSDSCKDNPLCTPLRSRSNPPPLDEPPS